MGSDINIQLENFKQVETHVLQKVKNKTASSPSDVLIKKITAVIGNL